MRLISFNFISCELNGVEMKDILNDKITIVNARIFSIDKADCD